MKKYRKIIAALLSGILVIPAAAFAIVIPEGRATSGDLTISGSRTEDSFSAKSAITVASPSGTASTTVASVSGFVAGDYVLLHQTVGTGAGGYEIHKIRAIIGSSIFFFKNLEKSYQSAGAQVIKILEYHDVTVANGGSWSASSWNGTTGGILVALLNGSLLVQTGGGISAPGGFAGGAGSGQGSAKPAIQGNSDSGTGGSSESANGTGGGGGSTDGVPSNGGGGGGGHAGAGSEGACVGGVGCTIGGNGGGTANDVATLATSTFGGGGGGGGCSTAGPCTAGSGGTGAGFIFLVAASSTIGGSAITANGSAGSSGSAAGGGGGGGGSIRIPVRLNATLGSSITATAGAGGGVSATGGTGGTGRIATVSGVTITGSTNPTIDTTSTDVVRNTDSESIIISLGSSF